MKRENFETRDELRESAPAEKLVSEIWSDKLTAGQGLNRNTDQAPAHLPETQIADGGGAYIKFTEGRGLSEVGAYYTSRGGGGEMTLMGGIEFNKGSGNEYLLGFDYKESARSPRKHRSEKPTNPSEGNSSAPKPQPDEEGNNQDKPDRPNRPVRPRRP